MPGGPTQELGDRSVLAANHDWIALQVHLPFQAAVKAVHDTLKAPRGGVPPGDLTLKLASTELMTLATRRAEYDRWMVGFLS